MKQDNRSLYQALIARDQRFDGIFFVGVTSTGIYCRPICPVKPPKEKNCQFYGSAPEAEQAGFRPCLRCRPELAPGNAPVDDGQRIAQLVVQRIEEGDGVEKGELEGIANEFGLSSRQIRRIVHKELGVAPIQLLLTRRLLLAKQLLTETKLPMIEVGLASGFASLRRFNDAFRMRYGMPPSRLRKQAVDKVNIHSDFGTSKLQLSYRPPYDWRGMLEFLKARELKGVEWVTDSFYARTVELGKCRGWIRVVHSETKEGLELEFTHSLTPILPALLNRVRELFDLNARPELIVDHLRNDRIIGAWVKANPGLRVPGAFNGFEMGLRAILGQQVTVKAATTIAGRLAAALGEPTVTPFSELNRFSPSPERIARLSVDELARLGIISARCRCILALAQAEGSGSLRLDSGHHHNIERTMERLTKLPGIGEWTASYMAMRALHWPDAFPKGDIAVMNNLGKVSWREAEKMSEAWKPWRSYAVLHIWRNSKKSNAEALAAAKQAPASKEC